MGSRAADSSRESAPAAPLERFEFSHGAMGTMFELILYADSVQAAKAAAAGAWECVDAIERVATDYDPKSEARRLSETVNEWQAVSPQLAPVLRAADAAQRASGGAFDPSLGHVTKLWRRALRQGEWPTEERWAQTWAKAGWDSVELREGVEGLRVRLGGLGVRLDFGGVAKGVAVDAALGVLTSRGIESALMDGGGDLAATGPPPGEWGWRVEVKPFGQQQGQAAMRFLLRRGAIATSGDSYQSGSLRGVPLSGLGSEEASRFGHVLDPRLRLPLKGPRAALMTAKTAAEADAFATALMVIGRASDQDEGEQGLTSPLRAGIFFGSWESKPCVGALFPHDGVRSLTPLSFPEPE